MSEQDTLPEEEQPAVEEETPMGRFFNHQRRALEETAKALETILPPGFKEHGTEAGREFAKGFRVLVDAALDELKRAADEEDEIQAAEESEDLNDRPATTGDSKIKIDVD